RQAVATLWRRAPAGRECLPSLLSQDAAMPCTQPSDEIHPRPSRRGLLKTSAVVGLGLGLAPALGWAAPGRTRLPVRRRMVDGIDGKFHVLEQGEGPAILFCHGFPDTAETWRSQMQAVAEAGYRAVAIDMRGYGRSFAPEAPELYTALHITGDLIGVLDTLS